MSELTAGEAILKAYVQKTFGFEAMFVPQNAYVIGVSDVIKAVRGIKDPKSRQAAGFKALRAAINSTGDGGMVSDQQVNIAVHDLLTVIRD